MLLEFYGQECPHCISMMPLVEKLEMEMNVKVERFETWHNKENFDKMMVYAKDRCLGVPFLFNTDTEKFICGGATYQELEEWAKAA
jgi:thiol-disulfide isomerase/thioredoxin